VLQFNVTSPKDKTLNYSVALDETLAEAIKTGDDDAFQALMLRYMRHIYNFARQYAKSDEDAEDIVQDSFFKAWRHIKRFEKGKLFRPWLFTITRNTALDYVKKKRPFVFSELDDASEELSFADTLHDPEPLPQELFDRARLAANWTKSWVPFTPTIGQCWSCTTIKI